MLHNPAIRIFDAEDGRGELFELMEPMAFVMPPNPPLWLLKRRFTVPAGFASDGASVPRFLWRLLSPRIDPVTLAPSIAHDWLYAHGSLRDLTREECDRWYRDSLIKRGYPRWKSWVTYIGVRLFGGRHWWRGGKQHGGWTNVSYPSSCPKPPPRRASTHNQSYSVPPWKST